jgi:single-stranded DNA-binding protein
MSTSMNRCWLMGTIGERGFALRYALGGSAYASGTLVITERSTEGKEWRQYLPIECWGKRAESVSELAPGTLVTLEGKLARRKNKQEQWEVYVSTFAVEPVGALSLRQAASLAQAEVSI